MIGDLFAAPWPVAAGALLVCGSRTFHDYRLFCSHIDRIDGIRSIIHGGAFGADALAARYACDRHLLTQVFEADWHQYGRAAGPIRNRQMAPHAGCAIAFWDGSSAGTADMLLRLAALARPVRIVQLPR